MKAGIWKFKAKWEQDSGLKSLVGMTNVRNLEISWGWEVVNS